MGLCVPLHSLLALAADLLSREEANEGHQLCSGAEAVPTEAR
jgi:hypothetical protein